MPINTTPVSWASRWFHRFSVQSQYDWGFYNGLMMVCDYASREYNAIYYLYEYEVGRINMEGEKVR